MHSITELRELYNIKNIDVVCYDAVHNSICLNETYRVHPRVLYRMGVELAGMPKTWDDGLLKSPNDSNMFWAFVDGSCNNNKNDLQAAYGVYVGNNSVLNASVRAIGD